MTDSANLLAQEKSPYLLQHAANPVHWRPWGEDALEAARRADKPLFISIGYATCHWCHVMERESFEDDSVAAVLNDNFVCVKVDREERPDVDAVFMTACQMATGRGGWPLTIFATPDGEPFFAGTYLPPENRYNQTGLKELATHIGKLWREDRSTISQAATSMAGHLDEFYKGAAKSGDTPGTEQLDAARKDLAARYDQRFGGFGDAPKFPTPHNLVFLLRESLRTGQEAPRDMALHTLTAMRLGGVFDHVGHGFHRYSTDEKWLLPHFEKMLYDQAALALAYLEGFQASGAPLMARTAEEIFDYMLTGLAAPEGAFHSAEDADSEGEEGKFYHWTVDEVMDLLGADDAAFVNTRFGLLAPGNFRDESTGQMTGANIPHLRAPLSAADEARWEPLRRRLFEAREARVHPLKDDKILADWNGLAIAALAKGARVLDRPDLRAAAARAADFVLREMRTPDGALLHRWRAGEAAIDAHADDYAYLIQGLIELYYASFDPDHLARAVELQHRMDADFLDTEGGGYFLSRTAGPGLPARPKELYDGPIPSANSTALSNLLALSRLTGDLAFAGRAEAQLAAFAGNVAAQPAAYAHFLCGAAEALAPGADVVVAGSPGAPDTEALLSVLRHRWLPTAHALLRDPADERLPTVAPFTAEHLPVDGKAAAYVCRNRTCEAPVTAPSKLAELLDERKN